MPSGDNIKTWFPEMLKELGEMWKPEMDWLEINKICLHMGERLRSIREIRGNSSKIKCTCSCGGKMELSSKISIRSLLFSLKKIGAISDAKFTKLDKEWKKYQRKNELNGYHEEKK